MPKISQLTELAEDPAGGDMLAIVDVSAGRTKRVRADRLGGGAALTYPSFTWDHYNDVTDGFAIAAAASLAMPLNTTNGADPSALPSGWTLGAANYLLVPAGIYSVLWYWEDWDGAAGPWENVVYISGALDTGSLASTAPKAVTTSYFGSTSFTTKLVEAGGFRFLAINRDSVTRKLYGALTVTRLDA